MPSLKERREDISLLFRYFASEFAEKYRTSTIRLDEQATLLLEAYPWPGNIRELKNVTEQLSVMSEEKTISAENILQLIPKIANRNLPALRSTNGDGTTMEEREILYKLLFDMKKDLNDLKSLVFELINTNDLNMPDMGSLRQLQPVDLPASSFNKSDRESDLPPYFDNRPTPAGEFGPDQPVIIKQPGDHGYEKVEELEENLSLADMEKELIGKALKKYKGRRKDAATELGISERTLYRKIKHYKIDE